MYRSRDIFWIYSAGRKISTSQTAASWIGQTRPNRYLLLGEGKDIYQEIKDTLQHYLVYGVTNILIKMTGFILIPVYTRYLLPAEYGILSILMIVFSVASILYSLGMGAGLTRSYYDYPSPDRHRMVVSTALYHSSLLPAYFSASVLFSLEDFPCLIFGSPRLSGASQSDLPDGFSGSVQNHVLNRIPEPEIVEEVFLLYIPFFITQLGAILFLVTCLKLGVRGVVLGGLLSSGLSVFLLIPLKKDLALTFSWSEFKEMSLLQRPPRPR